MLQTMFMRELHKWTEIEGGDYDTFCVSAMTTNTFRTF